VELKKGQTIMIDVDLQLPAEIFHEAVSNRSGMPLEGFALYYQSKQLEGEAALSSWGVEKNATIEVKTRGRGGADATKTKGSTEGDRTKAAQVKVAGAAEAVKAKNEKDAKAEEAKKAKEEKAKEEKAKEEKAEKAEGLLKDGFARAKTEEEERDTKRTEEDEVAAKEVPMPATARAQANAMPPRHLT